ncbi:TPA: hypothetical protein ACHYVI_001175 [Klebsiella pneumoniae]
MTSKFNIDNRELLQRISCGEAVAGIDFGNLIVRELAAFRLAAMDSEPVAVTDDMAYAFHHALTDSMIGADDVEEIKTGLRAVFANLTAPVVSAEYPDRLPCSVLLEPGLRFGKGIKTSTMLAALARRAIYESDLAALSPEEKAEFQVGIEDVKALIAQPATVVPEEATPDSIEILASARRRDHAVFQWDEEQRNAAADSWNACRATMLQASPVCTCPSGNGSLRWPFPVHPGGSQENPDCWCRTCRPVVLNDMRFVVCPDCGNKRCPRANDHRNACTGSNEPGQQGSAYPSAPQEVKP